MDLRSAYETAKIPSEFQSCQIVFLECQSSRVYAEVIQIVESRQVCWVRPLILVEDCSSQTIHAVPKTAQAPSQTHAYDLRQGSDLLLPTALFHAATDLDAIGWMTALYTTHPQVGSPQVSLAKPQRLHQFVKQICGAHPELFKSLF